MDDIIMNQIHILQEMKSKCIQVCGYYGDIDTAIAALQICSTFGMDNSARLLGMLNNNRIKTYDDLRNVIDDSELNKSLRVIKNDSDELLCPKCNNKLEHQVKHCSECGQKLNFEDIFEKKPMIIDFENNEEINNDSLE